MRRHHLGHWRGTGRSQAARRGTTSTVRSDFFLPTQFDLSTLRTVSLARLLVDLHVVSCPTLNGFILAGVPLKNYWHSSFGLASSWRWGKGGIAPTLHFRNRWKTISPFVLLCRKTLMRRSWPQTQIAGFKKIHVLSFDFIIMAICCSVYSEILQVPETPFPFQFAHKVSVRLMIFPTILFSLNRVWLD